jgi:uncharacterized protein YpbB
MGSRIHSPQYEETHDLLEQIVNEDPDFENDQDQEFVEELSGSSLGGFTAQQAAKIKKLHARYVLQEEQVDHDDDDDE